MLFVKTVIKESGIAGMGLFAAQNIKKGTKIWAFKEGFDKKFTNREIAAFPKLAQEHIRTYAYLSKVSNVYIYPVDGGRFMNHSLSPNVNVVFRKGVEEDINIAGRDIKKGEELTVNYGDFDQEFADYKDTYM